MLPQYQRLDASRDTFAPTLQHSRFHIATFPRFAVLCLSVPAFAFAFCVCWSLLYDFERSTMTHCYVANVLPSLSAAIGNYQPQRVVWQSAILLTFLPRLWLIGNYLQLYRRNIRRNRRSLAYGACALHGAENLALVGLSLFTSTDDYEMHKLCFLIFIVTSELYMAISYFVNKTGRKLADPIVRRSQRLKRNLCTLNMMSFALAGYCFVRHNERCEPYMYTWFAAAEYLVVLTNMAFHMTASLDFYDQSIMFDWTYGFHMVPSSYIAV